MSTMFSQLSIFCLSLADCLLGALLFPGGACSCHPARTQHRIQKDTKPHGGESSTTGPSLCLFLPCTCSSLCRTGGTELSCSLTACPPFSFSLSSLSFTFLSLLYTTPSHLLLLQLSIYCPPLLSAYLKSYLL